MTAFDESKERERCERIANEWLANTSDDRPELAELLMRERKAEFEAGQAAEALKHHAFLKDLLMLIERFPNTSGIAWNPLRKTLMEEFR